MKRLLIICDLGHCPHRIPGWAEELSKLGWEVTVLSPKMTRKQREYLGISLSNQWKIDGATTYPMVYRRFTHFSSRFQQIYAKYHNFRYKFTDRKVFKLLLRNNEYEKFSSLLSKLTHLPWYSQAINRANKIVNRDGIGAVLSSSSPFVSHLIAREVSNNCGIPWIADFRDLWSLNHAKGDVNDLELEFETLVLRDCWGCTTATDGMSKSLSRVFDKKITTINNAYTGEIKTITKKDCLRVSTLVYTGTIYENYQDLGLICEALELLNVSELRCILQVYGFASSNFRKYCEARYNYVPKYIEIYNHVSVEQIRSIQAKADFLLFIDWSKNIGWESTKLIEYLPNPGKIIGTGIHKTSRAAQIIESTKRGVYFSDPLSLCAYFLNPKPESKNSSPDYEEIVKYSFAYQAIRLNDFLSSAIQSGKY